MPESRRLNLRLGGDLYDALQSVALDQQLSVSATTRLLVRRGLQAIRLPTTHAGTAAGRDSVERLQLLTLATLITAEQLGRFLAHVYPEGESSMLQLREDAVAAAERHLEQLKQQLDLEASA